MRNGKIARLPEALREELDQRLANGERTNKLLAWLNDRPEVQAVLREQFGGRPVNKQSVSEWRLGGHQDWRQRQELRRTVQSLAGEARKLDQAADPSRPDGGIETLYGVALVQAAQKMFGATNSVRVKLQLVSVMSRGLMTVRAMVHRAESARLVEQAKVQKQRQQEDSREFREWQRQALNSAAEKPAPPAVGEPEPAEPRPGKEAA